LADKIQKLGNICENDFEFGQHLTIFVSLSVWDPHAGIEMLTMTTTRLHHDSDEARDMRWLIAWVKVWTSLVGQLECSRDMDLVAYESHALIDRSERAQVKKSCLSFVSENVMKSSTPARVKKIQHKKCGDKCEITWIVTLGCKHFECKMDIEINRKHTDRTRGSLLLCMFCQAKFVAVFELANGLICSFLSAEPLY